MKKFAILATLLYLVSSTAVFATVSSASLGGFYSYEQITQKFNAGTFQDTREGTTIGLALRGSTFFKHTGKFGLRYDVRAGKMLNLSVDGQEVDSLGIRATGGLLDYTQGGADMVDNHAFLGLSAFVDYNHALLNKLVLNVGANAKMPLVGYVKAGTKNNPTEGTVSVSGIEISPYIGVSYVF